MTAQERINAAKAAVAQALEQYNCGLTVEAILKTGSINMNVTKSLMESGIEIVISWVPLPEKEQTEGDDG